MTTATPPLLRAPSTWLLPALLAVLLAACAQGAGTGTATSSPPTDSRDAALLYAQCMRTNGVPDFPDPDADGRFSVGHGEGGVDQDDPKFRSAAEACRALAPGGEHEKFGDPAFVEQMREFSQCMRDNGLPDFPDPDAEGRLRGVGHEARGPTYEAAFAACRERLPGGGEHQ
jgi:hypothetical protein